MPLESLSIWDPDIEPKERARRSVAAQKLIANLPTESYRRDRDLQNVRLYENDPCITLYDFAGQYYSEVSTLALPPAEQSDNNRAKAAIDTLAAQVSSTDQRYRFKVVDGGYRQRRRGREMQNFSDGLAHELRLHRLKRRAWMDASILHSGLGFIQFYEEGGRCRAQRVLATEVAIDPRDGLIDGKWRTISRHRPMPRAKVQALFGGPDDSKSADVLRINKAIADATPVAVSGAPGDYVGVYETWTLPGGEKTKDGWHIVALDHADGDLLVEQYTKDHHELVALVIEERFTTGWGLSLMTQARKLQIRINANSYRIDRAQKLFHAGHLYLNKAARMEKSKISNEIGSVWEGSLPADQAIKQITFDAVKREMYDQVERDGQRIFENLGISLHTSQAVTNTGLDASGAAKREEKATADERNSLRQQRWEDFGLDCMRAALGVVRQIVAKKGKRGGYEVAVPGKRGLTVADWKEAALDEKNYVMETRPASWIPTEPQGLIAMGREMVDLGAWSPQKFAGFMQDLDLDGRTSRGMSKERQLEKTFEKLLYDKVAAAMPDEFTPYELALEIGTDYLAQGEEDDVPEKNLERVRRYLKRCKLLDAKAKAAAAPPAQAGAPGPQAQASAAPPQLAAVPAAA